MKVTEKAFFFNLIRIHCFSVVELISLISPLNFMERTKGGKLARKHQKHNSSKIDRNISNRRKQKINKQTFN